jgi:dihydrofolate reductase
MRKIILQNMITVDGAFEGKNHEIDWHNVDAEFNEYAINFLHSIDTLIFGRLTYQLMVNYWPTPQAEGDDPIVADLMNTLPKMVYSRTLAAVPWGRWNNARLYKECLPTEIKTLKEKPGKDMAMFGSSNLALTFLRHGLIDEFHIFINPMVLGGGHTLFDGLIERLALKLLDVHRFNSDNVLLVYRPLS